MKNFLSPFAIASLVIAISIFYFFVVIPFQEKRELSHCLENAQEEYLKKQEEINRKIEEKEEKINEIKPDIEVKVSEIFSNLPPKPPKEEYESIVVRKSRLISLSEKSELDIWLEKNRDADLDVKKVEKPLRDLEWDISRLNEDLNIIVTERESAEDNCYKRYK